MTRDYKPKNPQRSAVWTSDDGLPPETVAQHWRDFGPTANRNAKGKLRETSAFTQAFLNFRAQGIPLPTDAISDEHLMDADFVEALRICGSFSTLGGMPPGKNFISDGDTNDVWAAYLSSGGVMSSDDRRCVRDSARHYMRKVEAQIG